jgi:hypothetical protein
LQEAGNGTVRVPRAGGINAQDLAAMSRQSGGEVALYRNASNGERFIAIGNRTGVNIPENSRLIAHTQPGTGAAAVRASVADEAALARLGQRSSVIIDEGGTAASRFRPTERGAELARTETGPVRVRAPEVGNPVDEVAAPLTRQLDQFDEIAAKVEIEIGHILTGELRFKPDGSVKKAVGFHLREGGQDLATARVKQIIEQPNAAGVYQAKVQIKNPADGSWVDKSGKSTFYPDHMTPGDVETAVRNAYADALRNGNVTTAGRFEGDGGLGFKIVGFVENNSMSTAYPQYFKD